MSSISRPAFKMGMLDAKRSVRLLNTAIYHSYAHRGRIRRWVAVAGLKTLLWVACIGEVVAQQHRRPRAGSANPRKHHRGFAPRPILSVKMLLPERRSKNKAGQDLLPTYL